MKKKLFTLVLLLMGVMLCPSNLAAQEMPAKRTEKFRHHEVSVGYGFAPFQMVYDNYRENWKNVIPFINPIYNITSFYGAFDISYRYRFNRKFSVGLSLAIYGYNDEFTTLLSKDDSDVERKRRFISVLPMFRWNWYNRRGMSLYSAAGIGYRHERRYTDGVESTHSRLAWQLTGIGIEYGKQFLVFAEYGGGDLGSLNAGVRLRF
jgi:hypothetical protein